MVSALFALGMIMLAGMILCSKLSFARAASTQEASALQDQWTAVASRLAGSSPNEPAAVMHRFNVLVAQTSHRISGCPVGHSIRSDPAGRAITLCHGRSVWRRFDDSALRHEATHLLQHVRDQPAQGILAREAAGHRIPTLRLEWEAHRQAPLAAAVILLPPLACFAAGLWAFLS